MSVSLWHGVISDSDHGGLPVGVHRMLTGRKRVAPLVFMTPDTSSPALVRASGCSLVSNW